MERIREPRTNPKLTQYLTSILRTTAPATFEQELAMLAPLLVERFRFDLIANRASFALTRWLPANLAQSSKLRRTMARSRA
jgi:hypothetical protein